MVLADEERSETDSSDIDEAAQTHEILNVVWVFRRGVKNTRVYACIENIHTMLLDSGIVVCLPNTIDRWDVYTYVVGCWIR